MCNISSIFNVLYTLILYIKYMQYIQYLYTLHALIKLLLMLDVNYDVNVYRNISLICIICDILTFLSYPPYMCVYIISHSNVIL